MDNLPCSEYSQLYKESWKMRVKEQDILKALKEWDGLTCNDIAERLNKYPIAVQKVLQALEASEKVVVRIRRKADRSRECCYFLPSSRSLNTNKVVKPKTSHHKKTSPNSGKTRTMRKSDHGGCYVNHVEYKPPFVDADGNKYWSAQEVMNKLKINPDALRYRLRVGAIGSDNNLPHYEMVGSGQFHTKYFPPFVDLEGNQFASYEDGAWFHHVSISTFRHWVYIGKIGCKGNPPTNKEHNPVGRETKYKPPYVDQQGNVYQTREEVQEAWGISLSAVYSHIYRGTLGCEGSAPGPNNLRKPVTDGVNLYSSIGEAAKSLGLSKAQVRYRVRTNKDGWRLVFNEE